ncbi:MAG: energy-coupling factor ABC transporter permease [Actinobacteria bacterium]|nr:energy-coupling factor ABC transporter permease [Actinomycetota bacterium]MBL7124424.1 energy-coupling factor ABC transporter permease [Actinomycetota bacterium]
MHIPDGFIDLKTAVSTAVVSAGGLAAAIYKVKSYFKAKVIALMGIISALIFALQMINFSIPGGTSGHLLGGALAAIVLGPNAGAIVIAVVLIVQAFVFMDGGVVALGANVFNMAIVGVYGSYLIYWLISKISKSKIIFFTAVALASWLSVVIASFFAALELGISGTYALGITLKAMVGVHMIIGIGEAVITVAVIAFINKVRPDLILTRERSLQ